MMTSKQHRELVAQMKEQTDRLDKLVRLLCRHEDTCDTLQKVLTQFGEEVYATRRCRTCGLNMGRVEVEE